MASGAPAPFKNLSHFPTLSALASRGCDFAAPDSGRKVMSNCVGFSNVLARMAVMTACVLLQSVTRNASAQQSAPPHSAQTGSGLFLDPALMMPGVSDLGAEAIKYYQAIGIYAPGTYISTPPPTTKAKG